MRVPSRCAEVRIGLVGGMANAMYCFTRILRQQGYDADYVVDEQDTFPLSQPLWEEVPLALDLRVDDGEPFDAREWSSLTAQLDWRPPDWVVHPDGSASRTRSARLLGPALRSGRRGGRELMRHASANQPLVDTLASYDRLVVCGIRVVEALLSGTPFVYWPHGGDVRVVPFREETPFDRAFGRAIRKAVVSAAVAGTHDPTIADRLEELGRPAPIPYLPFLVDVARYSPGEPTSDLALDVKALAGERRILFHAARQDFRWKATDRFARAFATVVASGAPLYLVLSPWGADFEATRQIFSDAGVLDSVHYLESAVSKPILRDLYRISDAVVDQFSITAFGAVMLEAMACGTPVLINLDVEAFVARWPDFVPPPVLRASTEEGIREALDAIADGSTDLPAFGRAGRVWIESTTAGGCSPLRGRGMIRFLKKLKAWAVTKTIHLSIWLAINLTAVIGYLVLRMLTRRERHRPQREKPRLFWGTIPMINMKYHSQAMRRLGYESETVVAHIYDIHSREDYDVLTSELVEGLPFAKHLPRLARRLIEPYVTFAWAIKNFDVFTIYTTGTILRTTPLRHRDLQLLHRAGKKIVLLAYGADVQVMSRFRGLPFKHAMCMDYPQYTRQEAQTLRDMEYCVAHSDHVMSGVDWVDYMPRWDSLNAGHFAIDTAEWTPAPESEERDPDAPIVIFHAPNHRELKGTRFLIDACEELVAEGEPIELRLVERVPNTEIRRRLAEADIVADQFIVGWYALFAIEAMAMAKPTLCFLREDLLELYTLYSFAGECPLVNTPALEIKEQLRPLIHDAARRRGIGLAGRRYVEKNHSLEAVGAMFDGVYRELWGCLRRPQSMERIPSTSETRGWTPSTFFIRELSPTRSPSCSGSMCRTCAGSSVASSITLTSSRTETISSPATLNTSDRSSSSAFGKTSTTSEMWMGLIRCPGRPAIEIWSPCAPFRAASARPSPPALARKRRRTGRRPFGRTLGSCPRATLRRAWT